MYNYTQRIMREREYPPIINVASRTLAAPLKEQQFYRTPSQTIGNNYSPHVQHLRVKGLYQQLKAIHKHTGLLASYFLTARCDYCNRKLSVRPFVCRSVMLMYRRCIGCVT